MHDALGTSTQGMWHDPNGIIYPYDAEDMRLIATANRLRTEEVKADRMDNCDE